MVSALAELSGCPADSVGLVECLRTRPAAYLVALFDLEYKVTKSHVCYLPIKSLVLVKRPLVIAFGQSEALIHGNNQLGRFSASVLIYTYFFFLHIS